MSETQAKPRRRWFQVSLREWFLVVALSVVGLGWWRDYQRVIEQAVELQQRDNQILLSTQHNNQLATQIVDLQRDFSTLSQTPRDAARALALEHERKKAAIRLIPNANSP